MHLTNIRPMEKQEIEAVVHEEASCRFVFACSNGKKAYLEYREGADGNLWDIVHTFVPPDCRGKGLGAILCVAAFRKALQRGIRIVPSCTYVSGNFLKHYPQFQQQCEAPSSML